MSKGYYYCAAALLVAMAAAVAPATAQFPPTPDDPQGAPPLAAKLQVPL